MFSSSVLVNVGGYEEQDSAPSTMWMFQGESLVGCFSHCVNAVRLSMWDFLVQNVAVTTSERLSPGSRKRNSRFAT